MVNYMMTLKHRSITSQTFATALTTKTGISFLKCEYGVCFRKKKKTCTSAVAVDRQRDKLKLNN